MRRIFVAVALSQNLQDEIERWQNDHGDLDVRWQSGKNLHITLVPPWHAKEVDSTIKALRSIIFQPFDITLKKLSFGPNPKSPRLIWAMGQAPEGILSLRLKIFNSLGQKPEGEFKLHVTMARFKPEDYRIFPSQNLYEHVDWRQHVTSFVLMETHRTLAGSDYEVLGTFPAA